MLRYLDDDRADIGRHSHSPANHRLCSRVPSVPPTLFNKERDVGPTATSVCLTLVELHSINVPIRPRSTPSCIFIQDPSRFHGYGCGIWAIFMARSDSAKWIQHNDQNGKRDGTELAANEGQDFSNHMCVMFLTAPFFSL